MKQNYPDRKSRDDLRKAYMGWVKNTVVSKKPYDEVRDVNTASFRDEIILQSVAIDRLCLRGKDYFRYRDNLNI